MTVSPKRHIAVLRFSSAGDIVLTAPALSALAHAWPQSRITFVTQAHFAPLVASHPSVSAVLSWHKGEGFLALRRRILTAGCDALLDLHGKARGALLRASLPRLRCVGWHKRDLRQSLAVRLGGARVRAPMHIAARYHQAVETLVGRPLPRQPLTYHVSEADQVAAGRLLVAQNIDLQRPLVGMSPGAMWATKRWPPAHFAALARWAVQQGVQVVLTGSPAEKQVSRAVHASAPGSVDLTGTFDLGVLGGVIARCQAFVANDSGPMHIARALHVPTLAFFGSTDPGQFDFTGHALLFRGLECSPCSFHGLSQCPLGHMACLLGLSWEAAAQALKDLLARGRVQAVLG